MMFLSKKNKNLVELQNKSEHEIICDHQIPCIVSNNSQKDHAGHFLRNQTHDLLGHSFQSVTTIYFNPVVEFHWTGDQRAVVQNQVQLEL